MTGDFVVSSEVGSRSHDGLIELCDELVVVFQLFPKLARAFFNVIDVFASEHMTGLPMMPHSVLVYIFQALGQVIPLPSPDATCSSMACSTIDKICTFVLNWLIKNRLRKDGDGDVDEMHDTTLDPENLSSASGGSNRFNSGSGVDLINNNNNNTTLDTNSGLQRQQGTHWLVDYVMSNKGVLRFLFMVLFKAVTYENRSNHWSLSRPLLGLILLNREFYSEYVMRFVQAQLPDRQEQVQKAVDGVSLALVFDLKLANR
jgi:exportin-7